MKRERYDVIIRAKQEMMALPGISLHELSRQCECQHAVIRRFVEIGLLVPQQEGEIQLFEASAVIRVRKALRLKRDLRLNFDAVAVVIELLDRIEELERELPRRSG